MPGLTTVDWTVRAAIYRTFAESGSAPTIGELSRAVNVTVGEVRLALRRLESAHEVAPLPNGDGVWMANPFSALRTDYQVETPHMTCYANCAWDALGVPAILDTDGWIRTHCAGSGERMSFGVRDGRLQGDTGVICLVTPPRDAWNDIGFT